MLVRRIFLFASLLLISLLFACTRVQTEPSKTAPALQNPTTAVQKTLPTVQVPGTQQPETTQAVPPTPVIITPIATSAPVRIPDPGRYAWLPVINGIQSPTDIQSPRDGSGRLFILEQPGRILIWKDGQLVGTPFLDIRDRVGNNGSEQGLLGLAFHPRFSKNGHFFVNYTDRDGNTHIARFTSNGDIADTGSEKLLLFVHQPFPNHNGGALAFGPDGYLTIGLGDGGSAGDPYANAQSHNSLLGKLLRLDVNQGEPYAIPTDNPYLQNGTGSPEIWAIGLRNPWRFSFDRLTGDLWIGDVGQNLWEEIDFIPAGTPGGMNLGWNKMEANHPYNGSNQPEFSAPVAEYPHGAECSISGGYVYRGTALPEWQGVYFFGDYCSGAIWGLTSPPQAATPILLFQTGFKISTFGLDENGEIYLADYNGVLYRLEKLP